jgi:hypothetical protein
MITELISNVILLPGIVKVRTETALTMMRLECFIGVRQPRAILIRM